MNIHNEEELRRAIRNKVKRINIVNNITLTDGIVLQNFFSINGNKKTITFENSNGISIIGNFNKIKNLSIKKSSKNGISIVGSFNKIKNVFVLECSDTGIIISKGGSYNKIINCISCLNNSNKGNADGFACKLKSGRGNIFKKCHSTLNEDDGFDLFAAEYSVRFISCTASSNGKAGTGSGFKLGGLKQIEDLNRKIYHRLYKCVSNSNGNYGFTSNNQIGRICLKKCLSFENGKEDFFFPSESHPKALDKKELKLGKTTLIKCFSDNKDNLTGAVIKSLEFFSKK